MRALAARATPHAGLTPRFGPSGRRLASADLLHAALTRRKGATQHTRGLGGARAAVTRAAVCRTAVFVSSSSYVPTVERLRTSGWASVRRGRQCLTNWFGDSRATIARAAYVRFVSADRAHGGRRRGSWRQRWCRQRWCRPRPQRRRGARPGRVHWHTQRGFRGTLARVRILERLPDARMRPSMSSMRWAGGVRSQPSSALRALEKTRAGCCTALSVSRRVVRPGRQKRGTGRSRSDPPPGRSIPDGLRCENTRRLPWKTRPNVNLTCEGGRTSANHS